MKVFAFVMLSAVWSGNVSIASARHQDVGAFASPASPVSFQFGKRSVSVSGTPGGQVVVFGIAREFVLPKVPVLGVVRRAIVLSDPAKTGTFTLDLGEPLPYAAIWVAVDLTTGAYAAAGSPGYVPIQTAPTAAGLKQDNAGQLKKLELAAPEMEMLLVRPGQGAWRLYATKFGRRDENAADPEKPIRIDVGSAQPLEGSPPAPPNFKNGDVVVLIDPQWMKYRIIEVGR